MDKLSAEKIEDAVQEIAKWREKAFEEIQCLGQGDWLKGAIMGAVSELANAQDCLAGGDLEAAILQARYSSILVASPILKILRGAGAHTPSERYMEIARRNHPYAEVMQSVMHFCHNRRFQE